jgi:hypothetical protein
MRIRIRRGKIGDFRDWGAPFIIAFIIPLMVCAGILAFGNEGRAKKVSIEVIYSNVSDEFLKTLYRYLVAEGLPYFIIIAK